jgi:hypothetical protein
VLTGAQRQPPEEAAGTSRSPGEILKAGPGYKNIINTDLVDDPMLTSSGRLGLPEISGRLIRVIINLGFENCYPKLYLVF